MAMALATDESENETSLVLLLLLFSLGNVASVTFFTIENRCSYTVWTGILAVNGTAFLGSGGFHLLPGIFFQLAAPPGWLGRFWGRTGCFFDGSGNGKCATGDCAGRMRCTVGGTPPVTVAEFSIGTLIDENDFYAVSVAEGYNVAMAVRAIGGSGDCQYAECSKTFMSACSSICTCSRSDYLITFCPYGSS